MLSTHAAVHPATTVLVKDDGTQYTLFEHLQ
jgi:hypothetical protein